METDPDIGFWNDTVYCGIICISQWTYASGVFFPKRKYFYKDGTDAVQSRHLYQHHAEYSCVQFRGVLCGHFKIRQPEEPAGAEDGCRCPDGTDYCIDDGFETAYDPGCDCSIILELDLQRCDVWIHQNASIQLLVLGKIRFLRTPSFWRVSFIS